MAQQGSGPPRYTRAPAPGARDQGRPPAHSTGTDDDLPPWVVPHPALPGRAQATRARRARRRLHLWGGTAAVAAVIAVGIYFLVSGGGGTSPARPGGFVTTYLPGEYRSVPGMCGSLSAATLGQFLPGRPTRAALPGLNGNAGNEFDWTLDHRPVYRLLHLTAQAYAPSGLATGNGSATAAATDAYVQMLEGDQHPGRRTHLPPAQITVLHGLGTVAFSAFQVIRGGGDTTDRVTVVARQRNVLVIAEFSGLARASRGGYGPVPAGQLAAGAAAAARDALARIGT